MRLLLGLWSIGSLCLPFARVPLVPEGDFWVAACAWDVPLSGSFELPARPQSLHHARRMLKWSSNHRSARRARHLRGGVRHRPLGRALQSAATETINFGELTDAEWEIFLEGLCGHVDAALQAGVWRTGSQTGAAVQRNLFGMSAPG